MAAKRIKEPNKEKIIDFYCQEDDDNLIFMDGFDDAIVGVMGAFGSEYKVCYDKNKVFDILIKDGMTYEEAVEWYEYNIIGAYVGEKTPVFLNGINEIE